MAERVNLAKRISLCGIFVALGVVVMMISAVPVFYYTMPAVSGALLMIVMAEYGGKYAFLSYVATAILCLIFVQTVEPKILYVGFFGFYPILKGKLEHIKNRMIEYIVKFAVFNAAIILCYTVMIRLFGMSEVITEFGDFGQYTPLILLAVGNVVFILMDVALTRAFSLYMRKYHTKFHKIIK